MISVGTQLIAQNRVFPKIKLAFLTHGFSYRDGAGVEICNYFRK